LVACALASFFPAIAGTARADNPISSGISDVKRLESELTKAQQSDNDKLSSAIRQMRILKSEASDVSLSLKSKQDSISTDVNAVKRREDRVENVVRELNDRVRALERAMDYLPGANVESSSHGSSEISVRQSSERSESGSRSEASRHSSSGSSSGSGSSKRSQQRQWISFALAPL